ncbi:MAG: hypothetical protein JWM05_3374 [Acidimicrobiales bacterium]|nr:hypothetical protein [Acidimicrobiales bacterium]
MFPFWKTVIAPVIRAAGARRIVEIGALRGEMTTLMLDDLGPDVELHVIDPVPAFDPAEHEQRFPGRYVFHKGLSLEVLDKVGGFDVALLDGDHNWYTVYNELRLLAQVARAEGKPLPVMVLHDVLWPYGRRDLYYGPDTIPAEFRQPYRMKGIRPGRKQLLPGGGLNEKHYNAELEGGPRNGVMTGLEDFMAEHDHELRVVVLPIYFGLAIVVEKDRLAKTPELNSFLDQLESLEGKHELLELSEDIRLEQAVFDHNAFALKDRQIAAARNQYLDLLKGALLDEHYLENEMRIKTLLDAVKAGRQVGVRPLRDPVRHLRALAQRIELARRTGHAADDRGITSFFPHTTMGRPRLDHLQAALDTVREDGIAGDLAECGVGRGGGAIFLRGYLSVHDMADRQVWVVDEFRAAPDTATPEPAGIEVVDALLADVNQVRDNFAHFGLLDDRVRFLQGRIADSLVDAPIEQLAVLRIGPGLGAAAGDVLDRLYDRLADGGFLIVDDYSDPACQAAVDAFRARRGITTPVDRVDWSAGSWRRDGADSVVAVVAEPSVLHRVPLVPPATKPVDLSVVVVFYNMKREAPRTLQSLSRGYQRGIEDVTYEVIAIDNGSDPDQKLTEAQVTAYGPEFRFLDLGAEATPSPTDALNRGLKLTNGKAIALMIDGAHVLTPGVLKFGLAGLSTYAPAVVATQQWYVGPGQQGDVMNSGYDQALEDELFQKISWPGDGYRLFEIGHFMFDRDWFDGMQESNCIFAPRSLLEQVGGFDDSFSMPGAGYANLDLWERLASGPEVTMASILGEGSFHQFHGGTTTNLSDDQQRRQRVFSYGSHYDETRGRLLHAPGKPIHYVGGLPVMAARRTRARRMSTEMFAPTPANLGPDARPTEPIPIPDELKWGFIEAFWHNLAWKQTTWLGHRVAKSPTDLFAYQELIHSIRPDWIIETGSGNGGRALFLASICDLVGHGQVVSVSRKPPEDVTHPRITLVAGTAQSGRTVGKVRQIVGESPKALVILGSRGRWQRMMAEFEAYAPMVPVGSYVVMEETVVNGHPVWPGFGAGPFEAVSHTLLTHGEFVADRSLEKFGLTLNPGGYLKRLK